jgi:hypothetical protein
MHGKLLKYKKKILQLNQIGGDDLWYKKNLELYVQFLMENKKNILLEDIERDFSPIDIQKRKYIECYYGIFRSLIEILINNIHYETFEMFYEKITIMTDILKRIKTENDIYILIFKYPKDTIRKQNLLTKSNIWCNHIVGLNMTEQIDYIFEDKNDMIDGENKKEITKFITTLEIIHPGKNFVFINADDCSYSGNQLREYIQYITSFDSNNTIQFITLIPFIINKSVLDTYIRSIHERFKDIIDLIIKWSTQVKTTSNIIDENMTLYNDCLSNIKVLFTSTHANELIKTERDIIFNNCLSLIYANIRLPHNSLNYKFINPIRLKKTTLNAEQLKENTYLNDKIKQTISKYLEAYIDSILYNTNMLEYDSGIKGEFNNIIQNVRILNAGEEPPDSDYYYYDDELIQVIIGKIRSIISNFVTLKYSYTSLIYFDFTFADNVSVNRYLLTGALLQTTLHGFVNKNRAEEIGLDDIYYLTENEKKCYMGQGCVPIVANCQDVYLRMENPNDDSISCPTQLYKKIIYKLNTRNMQLSDSELNTITGSIYNNSLINILRYVYL